jgi:hypothetical protein|eukprot:6915511-Prymnesium_polylepis.2
MYTILQKLDNIERALHRYDEARQVSLDTVPYRATGDTSTVDHDEYMQEIFKSFLMFVLENPKDTTRVSLSDGDFNLSFVSDSATKKFNMNASNKKDDQLCTVTGTYDQPDIESEKFSTTFDEMSLKINSLWPAEE